MGLGHFFSGGRLSCRCFGFGFFHWFWMCSARNPSTHRSRYNIGNKRPRGATLL